MSDVVSNLYFGLMNIHLEVSNQSNKKGAAEIRLVDRETSRLGRLGWINVSIRHRCDLGHATATAPSAQYQGLHEDSSPKRETVVISIQSTVHMRLTWNGWSGISSSGGDLRKFPSPFPIAPSGYVSLGCDLNIGRNMWKDKFCRSPSPGLLF